MAALLFGLNLAGAAQAVPVYVYSFTQTGYLAVDPAFTQPGTVTGSFSGTLDSTGHITRNTLTSYHFEIGGYHSSLGSWSSDTAPAYFSYVPGDTGSLALIDVGLDAFNPVWNACIGAPVGFTCDGGSARGATVLTLGSILATSPIILYLLTTTDTAPVISGFMIDIGDPVYITQTPVPASLLLSGTALGGLSLLAFFRRRKAAVVRLA